MKGLKVGADGYARCWWGANDGIYAEYHDWEWGRPVIDDVRLFEKICLEGFQSGLSWLTILKKRENFRKAFKGFDFEKVARFNESSVQRLLKDAGIVRHPGKIRSTINNAKQAIVLRDEFGSLSKYFWQFEPDTKTRPKRMTYNILKEMTESKESQVLCKDLKKRGWTFVGPVNVYAFMQAMGLVDDHLDGCWARGGAY
ncbi:MAG: DNA-3-methyladenine glycosylase I [Candidatus Latescibacterota bacterium]|nr:DNA-3-methyladenine glycosylase I [Candidatus Latescibacterota bacterium]